MKLIRRKKCIMCDGKNENFYSFKDFPIYMGTTNQPIEEDKFEDMNFSRCLKCGCVQITDLIPLDILYAQVHANVIGKTWKRHHEEFSKFAQKFCKGNIVEVGGSNLVVANHISKLKSVNKITVYDNDFVPNNKILNAKVFLKKEFFNSSVSEKNIDVVMHTHLIEHLYDPLREIKDMAAVLNEGGFFIFAMPVIDKMLKDNFTNAMNFEHTYLLDKKMVKNILHFSGLEIVDQKDFSPYASFFAAKKSKNANIIKHSYTNHFDIFNNFCNHHLKEVENIKNQINADKNNTFIFGAHIFTQYLFGFGLNSDLFCNILDNDPKKQNNRLYGTNLYVKSPRILKDIESPLVVLKAAMYTEEIKKDILENINPNTRFIL